MIAMSIEMSLADAGVDSVDIATTQTEAITAARLHRPDLITSDVTLAEGTGPEAVRQIHAELGEIPVVFLTGTPDDCIPCDPPAVILPKPFDARVLIAALGLHAPT